MIFTTTITQKGQATIPLPIRKKLGMKPNGKVAFQMQGDTVTIKPVPDFFYLKGSIKSKKPFDIEAMDKAIHAHFKKTHDKKSH